MADTQQIVQWALGQNCRLRDSEDSKSKPSSALESTATARAYSRGLRNREHGFGVFGGIYVSSCTFGTRPGSKKFSSPLEYPSGGFVVADEFEKFGGPESLFEMCQQCPANVMGHEIASCAGTIYQWPGSPDTQAQLEEIISRIGLQGEMDDCFPATKPIWYGLWAVSPVPAKSLSVLRKLLTEMLTEDSRDMSASGKIDHDHVRQFSYLLRAIQRAETNGLSLNVELLPLGHTDFGVYTVFPHCPFCKATARVERWQRKYPTTLHTCDVCATRFSPAETACARRINWDRRELREILGQEKFLKFATEYLVERGEALEDAIAIVQATEAEKLVFDEKNRQRAELEARRKRYLEEHVFRGLQCMEPPPPEFPFEDEKDELQSASTGWFNAENLAQVLDRCERLGIKVTMLQHRSFNGERDRFEMNALKAPLDILSKWQAEGCDERFYACCRVPDSLVINANP